MGNLSDQTVKELIRTGAIKLNDKDKREVELAYKKRLIQAINSMSMDNVIYKITTNHPMYAYEHETTSKEISSVFRDVLDSVEVKSSIQAIQDKIAAAFKNDEYINSLVEKILRENFIKNLCSNISLQNLITD